MSRALTFACLVILADLAASFENVNMWDITSVLATTMNPTANPTTTPNPTTANPTTPNPTSANPTTLNPTSNPTTANPTLNETVPTTFPTRHLVTDSPTPVQTIGGVPSWVIGVMMATGAAIASNLGLTLQKKQHDVNEKKFFAKLWKQKQVEQHWKRTDQHISGIDVKCPESHEDDDDQEIEVESNFVKQPMWQLGLGLVIFGSFADFFALSFASLTVIAPLGSLTLVTNVVFAPLLLGEKITSRDIGATFAIVTGSVLCVTFAAHSDKEYEISEIFGDFVTTRFFVYTFVILSFMGVLRYTAFYVGQFQHREKVTYAKLLKYQRFAWAALAGTMGAQSVLFAKCTAQLLDATFSGKRFLLLYWETYPILVGLFGSLFLQVRWLNVSLQMFSSVYVVPVFQSFWISVSVLAGMVFFGEYEGIFNDAEKSIFFPTGMIITISGVAILSKREQQQRKGLNENTKLMPDSASNSSAYEHHPHLPHLMPSNPSPHGATPDTNYSLFDRADEDEPSKSVDPIETHGSPRKRSTPRKSSRTGRALPFLVGNIFSPSIHEVHDFNDGGEALDVGKI